MPQQVRFHRLLLYQRLLLGGVAVLVVGMLWLGSDYVRGRDAIAESRQAQIDAHATRIRDEVGRATRLIEVARHRAEDQLRSFLQEQVDRAFDIATVMHAELSPHQDRATVERAIIEVLRDVRFNTGRGYFFRFLAVLSG